MIIASYTNTNISLKSVVSQNDNGVLHVALKDTDANKFLPTLLTFQSKSLAKEKAQELVQM